MTTRLCILLRQAEELERRIAEFERDFSTRIPGDAWADVYSAMTEIEKARDAAFALAKARDGGIT
jgi:hypothetical protein